MKSKKLLSPKRFGMNVNMTPMIDVVFQLIIFFMAVAEFSRLETEDVALPVADKARVEERMPPGRVVINVDRRGKLIVAGLPVDFSTLAQWLRNEADSHKTKEGEVNVEVLVRSDGEAEFGRVQDIMFECARNGIWQLSFGAVTERHPREAPSGEER